MSCVDAGWIDNQTIGGLAIILERLEEDWTMGFVRTEDEIASIREVYARPRFGPGDQVVVRFRTDPGVYRRLLPPPLEPVSDPIASVAIGRWRSNCIGDFAGGNVTLAARHRGVEGAYPLVIWMNTAYAVDLGRDHFGEPKKLANATLISDLRLEGGRVSGAIDRFGVRVLEIEAEVGAERAEDDRPQVDRYTFNYRTRLTPDGWGLDGDAVLTRTRVVTDVCSERTGNAAVRLTSSTFDPVGDLPVLEILDATYQQHTMTAECSSVDRVAGDVFLPYHLGRIDDPLKLNTESLERPYAETRA